ncbi:hypothetical protein ACFOWE_00590 [Planomonospora corallina]|uniref:Beta-lactamase n=1 Tax=Planomonospora corallina TaxID=1806052 RepID=A0ABV8HYU5_9ACTN
MRHHRLRPRRPDHRYWSYLYGTRDGGLIAVQNVNGDRGMPPLGLFADVLDAAFRPAA